MNPYENLPPRAFWKLAVAGLDARDIKDLWTPKFTISRNDQISTLGSCFAQHISRALISEGFAWWNGEPAPPKLQAADKKKFGYEVFSVRTGNIYTVAMLRQWLQWSVAGTAIPAEIWTDGHRVYDPFRPAIEPLGFASENEMLALRQQTLRAMRSMLEESSVFIFTLGLTEAWINNPGGYVYPICPGTVAGTFDPEHHIFKNYGFHEIYTDMTEVLQLVKSVNPAIKILLTVSPVPLTATASNEHVLVATVHSKSILRAVASTIVCENDFVDYFPSYEIISSFPYRGQFYDFNLRSVTEDGVAHVMRAFFSALENVAPKLAADKAESETKRTSASSAVLPERSGADVVCEEMMLNKYGG